MALFVVLQPQLLDLAPHFAAHKLVSFVATQHSLLLAQLR
jgi:hypothetical protein